MDSLEQKRVYYLCAKQPRQETTIFEMTSNSDLDNQIERLRRCEFIKESEVKALCAKAREILIEEANVECIAAPVTV